MILENTLKYLNTGIYSQSTILQSTENLFFFCFNVNVYSEIWTKFRLLWPFYHARIFHIYLSRDISLFYGANFNFSINKIFPRCHFCTKAYPSYRGRCNWCIVSSVHCPRDANMLLDRFASTTARIVPSSLEILDVVQPRCYKVTS